MSEIQNIPPVLEADHSYVYEGISHMQENRVSSYSSMRLLNLPKRRPIRSDIPLQNRNYTCSSRNSPCERKSLIVLASMNSDTLPNVSSIFRDRQDERSFCTTVIAGITPGCSHARRTYRILKSALNIFLRKLNVRSRRCFTFLFRTLLGPLLYVPSDF